MVKRTGPRPQSRSEQRVFVDADLEIAAETERVGQWPQPKCVALVVSDAKPALKIEYDIGKSALIGEADARKALQQLASLEGGTVDDVRRFAQAFGSLLEPEFEMGVGYPVAFFRPTESGFEFVEHYREIGSAIAAVLRVAALVRRGRPVVKADLQLIYSALDTWGMSLRGDYTVKMAIDLCWERLYSTTRASASHSASLRIVPVGFVNGWLGLKSVRPFLTWDTVGPARVVWTGGLWGHIGAQLMAYVRSGESAADCDGCGRRVRRRRRPKSGHAVWCGSPECERHRARLAQQKSRERGRS